MNVFILCAGRTASTTLTGACKHITNFTSAHESRVNCFSTEKLYYPSNHIEIDNRLIWFSSLLDDKYKDNVKYVHLTRDRIKVAESYCERWHLNESIVKAFAHGILMKPKVSKSERLGICLDYVDFVEENITIFLRNKNNHIKMSVETLSKDFDIFWEFIDAAGNKQHAIDACNNKHNLNKTSLLGKAKRFIYR